jgi:hypothetical protein
MPSEARLPTLIPTVFLAVRDPAEGAWRMLTIHCEAKELLKRIAEIDLAVPNLRYIGTGEVAENWASTALLDRACQCGWVHCDDGRWFPIDEPMPPVPGTAVRSHVTIRLTSIIWGAIEFVVVAAGERLEFRLHDIQDEPITLARFAGILEAGGEPQACLADGGTSLFVVQNTAQPGLCRFHLRRTHEGRRSVTDVMTDRRALVAQFRALCTAVADHPYFAHHYLCHGGSDDCVYEQVLDAAELEWAAGVKEGRFPNDFDAQDAYEAAALVERMPLQDGCARLAEEYRTMLRTLEVPHEWLVRYGMAAPRDEAELRAAAWLEQE